MIYQSEILRISKFTRFRKFKELKICIKTEERNIKNPEQRSEVPTKFQKLKKQSSEKFKKL